MMKLGYTCTQKTVPGFFLDCIPVVNCFADDLILTFTKFTVKFKRKS